MRSHHFIQWFFDESFFLIFQDNQLDVHIRIWDSVKCQANTRYFTSNFLKGPNAENLLDVLLDAISCMNERKMIILSMDEKQKADKKNKIQIVAGEIHDVI